MVCGAVLTNLILNALRNLGAEEFPGKIILVKSVNATGNQHAFNGRKRVGRAITSAASG